MLDWDGGLPTEGVEATRMRLAHTYLELHVVQEGQREFRYPFCDAELDLGQQAAFPEGTAWTARLDGSQVVLVNRQSGAQTPLAVGESTLVEGRRVLLVDVRRPPLGTLEGVSPPYAGQVWHLRSSQSWLGRRGKRLNHIELDHPTVSRTHATVLPDPAGGAMLMSETAATSVNGEPVAVGQTVKLTHGDLIALGKLMFRFQGTVESGATEGARLFVQSLGAFRISLDSPTALPIEIRNEKARSVMAMLALHWGEPLSVERMLDGLWPDVVVRRGRKNLSHTLVQLKESLAAGGLDGDLLILRSAAEWRLNPEQLGQHDAVEVARLVTRRQPITSEAALNRLLELYKGRFFPSCYESWAEQEGVRLEADLTETLRLTGRHFLDQKSWDAAFQAGEKLRDLDSLDNQAIELMMEASLGMAKPERALACFEQGRIALVNEGLEPSVEMVKLSHRAKLGI